MGKATEDAYKKIIDILVTELDKLQLKIEELEKTANDRLEKSIKEFDKSILAKKKKGTWANTPSPRWYDYN
jgi:hypothetical protein